MKRGSLRDFVAKPFTIEGFYIAPEEETDKENIYQFFFPVDD